MLHSMEFTSASKLTSTADYSRVDLNSAVALVVLQRLTPACGQVKSLEVLLYRKEQQERTISQGLLNTVNHPFEQSRFYLPAPEWAILNFTRIYHHISVLRCQQYLLLPPALPSLTVNPGLSSTKRYSVDPMHHHHGKHTSDITRRPPTPPERQLSSKMPSRISYLPSQLDPLAGTSTRAARLSPTRLVLDDFAVLFHCLRYLPGIITPFWTRDKTDELYSGPSNARDIFLQFLLFFMQVAFLISAIPAILCLPFSILISFAVLACLAMILVASPMQGPRIAYSKMDDATMAMAEQHKDERWVFINGCITR